LWAEALVLFNLNDVMWQEAERLAPDVHQEFEKEDAWTEHLRDYLFAADMGEAAIAYVADGLKLVNVVKAAFDIQVKDINRAVLNRAADAMRKLGFIKRTRASGKVWVLDLA
jgi:hypothetical protein